MLGGGIAYLVPLREGSSYPEDFKYDDGKPSLLM